MQKSELAVAVVKASHLKGSFELRSGQISDSYFDKYRFEADPKLLDAITDQMLPLIPDGTQVLAGLELGGIPLATALSLKTGIPQIFVRKARKTYGTRKLAEGPDFAGKRVTIIEDIISTGGAVIDGTNELRADGAIVENVLCVILRRDDVPEGLSEIGLSVVPLFTLSELPDL